MGFFSNLFKAPSTEGIRKMIADGALLIDVRTSGEFASGHAQGSINIPLDQLGNQLATMDKDRPVVTVCASGMRSGSAANLLRRNGFREVYNGGMWIKYM